MVCIRPIREPGKLSDQHVHNETPMAYMLNSFKVNLKYDHRDGVVLRADQQMISMRVCRTLARDG